MAMLVSVMMRENMVIAGSVGIQHKLYWRQKLAHALATTQLVLAVAFALHVKVLVKLTRLALVPHAGLLTLHWARPASVMLLQMIAEIAGIQYLSSFDCHHILFNCKLED